MKIMLTMSYQLIDKSAQLTWAAARGLLSQEGRLGRQVTDTTPPSQTYLIVAGWNLIWNNEKNKHNCKYSLTARLELTRYLGGGMHCLPRLVFFLQLSNELTEHIYLLNHLQSSQKTWPWKDPRQIFLAPNDGQCLFESGYAGSQQGGYEYIRRPSHPRPCSVYANLNPTVGARCVQAEKKTNNWK